MLQPKRSGISRYILSVVSIGITLLISLLLHGVLATAPLFLLLLPVAFSAWYGGLGPGLFATVISTIEASYFFQEPLYSFHLSFNDFLVLCIFAVSAFFISFLSEAQMRAEEKVRQSEERYQLLLDNVKDYALIFLDPSGYITDWNVGTERLFGYHENEIIGQHFSKFFTPEDIEAGVPAQELAHAISQGTGGDERWHIRKDNSRFWSSGTTTPLYDREGKLRGFAKVARDTTERKRLTEELENQRARLLAVIHSIPDAIYIGDEHAIWQCNAAAVKMLGFNSQDDLKQDIATLASAIQTRYADSGAIMTATEQPFYHALKGATVIRDVLVRQINTGRDLIVRCAAAPIRTSNGAIIGAVAVNTDITERKKFETALRRSEERFRRLVETAPNAILLINEAGHIVMVNERVQALFGYELGELRGLSVDVLLPEHLRELHVQERNEYFANPNTRSMSVSRDIVGRRKDGTEFLVEIDLSNITTEEGTMAVAFITDVTERRRMEKDLQSWNKELEARVAERTAELEASVKELEGFSYSISHDLRAPLRAINGFANILLTDYRKQLVPEELKYIETMRDNALRMGRLIDDLLEFIRLSRKPLTWQAVNSREIVEETWDELQPERAGRRIELMIGELPTVNADRSMLKVVFMCLLSNAIKFTRIRDIARIEVGAQGKEGCALTFFVKDNGIGFEMQYADKIFGVFQQLNPIEDYDGTGAGLAVAQRIVRRHGGRIWAEAEPDHGATFYFTLETCPA